MTGYGPQGINLEDVVSDSVEIHYSISGLNQEEVLFSVFRMEAMTNVPGQYEQKQIHSSKNKPDGYYEAKYDGGSLIEFCFTKLDSQEKVVTFLVN